MYVLTLPEIYWKGPQEEPVSYHNITTIINKTHTSDSIQKVTECMIQTPDHARGSYLQWTATLSKLSA
jgi:hypothetical protein